MKTKNFLSYALVLLMGTVALNWTVRADVKCVNLTIKNTSTSLMRFRYEPCKGSGRSQWFTASINRGEEKSFSVFDGHHERPNNIKWPLPDRFQNDTKLICDKDPSDNILRCQPQ
jgi:hypothetical protein